MTTTAPRQPRREGATPGARSGRSGRSAATQGAKSGTIVVILLIIAFPLYSIVLTSFSNQASVNIAGGLVVWPHGLTLSAYKLIAAGGVVGRALVISVLHHRGGHRVLRWSSRSWPPTACPGPARSATRRSCGS